jgi:hypothetical protein
MKSTNISQAAIGCRHFVGHRLCDSRGKREMTAPQDFAPGFGRFVTVDNLFSPNGVKYDVRTDARAHPPILLWSP